MATEKTFTRAFEINRAAPAFQYVRDDTLYGGEGGWRPLSPDDFGSISISGAQISIDNGPVIAAIGSGNNSAASTATYSAPTSKAFTPTFAGSLLAKGAAGTLFCVNGFNNYTGIQYLHIFDNVDATANLVSVVAIDGKDNFSIDFGDKGITMNSGIFIRNSLTPVTQANGGNDLFITASFK